MPKTGITKQVSVTFTYPIPDDYLAQTGTLGKTATWTYNGPDFVWVRMWKDTNTYVGDYLIAEWDPEHRPGHPDEYLVKIDCAANPLLSQLLVDPIGKVDYATLDQHTETLPDGTTYTRPHDDNMPPDHAYNRMAVEYNPTTQTWVQPFPWQQPHSDWHDVRHWRNNVLSLANDRTSPVRFSNLVYGSPTTINFDAEPRPISVDSLVLIDGADAETTISINGLTGSALDLVHFYVVGNPTTTACQLSATVGGSPVTILTGSIGTANVYYHDSSMPIELLEQWVVYQKDLKMLPQLHGADSNVWVDLDLTAEAPINTEGHRVIQVTDVTGIQVGMGTDMQDHLLVDLFDHKTEVVSIDAVKKQIVLDDPLQNTPTESNKGIKFLSMPTTPSHKISGPIHPDRPDAPLIGHDRDEPDRNPNTGMVQPEGH